MARQIIILETVKGSDGVTNVRTVQWFPIAAPAARVPAPGFRSAAAALAGTSAQITASEQASLDDGSVREEVVNVQIAASATNAQIKAELVRRYSDRAAAIAAEPPTRQYFGVSYDGAAWSA